MPEIISDPDEDGVQNHLEASIDISFATTLIAGSHQVCFGSHRLCCFCPARKSPQLQSIAVP
jgi:hypothetical protein